MILPFRRIFRLDERVVSQYVSRRPTTSKRILIIDDTQEILDLYRLVLEPEGYEVHLSAYTYDDLKDIEHLHPDLVILDFLLGSHREGWQLLQRLKLYPPTTSIPIILCTAAVWEVREQEGYLREKGIPVVFKPFDLDELLQAIHQVLGDSSLEPPL